MNSQLDSATRISSASGSLKALAQLQYRPLLRPKYLKPLQCARQVSTSFHSGLRLPLMVPDMWHPR